MTSIIHTYIDLILHVNIFFLFFSDRVSLCNSPACPQTHFVDHAGLELNEIQPISASQVLELKACITTTRLNF